MWLPEPLLTLAPTTPDQMLERAYVRSVTFMILPERLWPLRRVPPFAGPQCSCATSHPRHVIPHYIACRVTLAPITIAT